MALPTLVEAISSLPAFARVVNTVPTPGERLTIGGLVGSSDAVTLAALVQRLATRFFVVIAEGVPQAERWLADLQAILDETPVALYPPREGFGEAEPHAESAGERVETLERVSRGDVRVLLTTARAVLERTRLPTTLRAARLELRKGDVRRPEEIAEHLEQVGFERVPMVDDVAQFSVRGGIFDIYSFGMADPVRLEFWGDEIIELRHFDLLSQRSTREADVAIVLPVDGHVSEDESSEFERVSVPSLWPPETIVILPSDAHIEPELQRTWDEAQHHLDLARRRGEDAPRRDELFQSPGDAMQSLRDFGTIAVVPGAGTGADVVFPIRHPDAIDRDIKRLRRVVRDGMPTIILCDNEGQAERLDELLNEDTFSPSPAALVIGVLDGGFVLPGIGGSPPQAGRWESGIGTTSEPIDSRFPIP